MRPYLENRLSSVALGVSGVVLALSLCGGLYYWETSVMEQRIRDREAMNADLLGKILHTDLQSVASTLQILADGDGLRSYLETQSPSDLERAARRAVFISRQQSSFDQVRYLDERGMEVVRVNHGGVLVPKNELQDKSDRSYFFSVRTLDPGKVLVSDFDLNVENGEIELPYKPMLRFSSPVFDYAGNWRGAYVINVLGGDLIKNLETASATPLSRVRLLNSRGFWLKAADPAQEWGFMIPQRASDTLAQTDPELWSHVSREPSGQMRRAGGLFTWKHVTAKDLAGGYAVPQPDGDAFLITASEMSADEWTERFAGLRISFGIVAAGLTILAVCSIGFFRARQRAAMGLRRSEQNLAVTLNSIGDAVMATDTAGNITRMNRVAEQLSGWPVKEALGRPIGDVFRIIHEFTREPAVIPVSRALASGEIQALANHTVLICRDGKERAIADSAAPIRDPQGVILGVVLVFRDVSEQRKAEDIQARFAAIIESSSDAILSTTPEGIITSWNDTAVDMFGYSEEAVLGQSLALILPPQSADKDDSSHPHQPIQQGNQLETIRLRKDGTPLHVSIATSPIKNPAGHITGISQIIRNITVRKQGEAKVHELNQELRDRAGQLEAANKELESFSYSVSHDLRAPLRHVQGYVEMLTRELKPPLSEKARRYLTTIATAGREMGELIDELLSFSRMGRTEMREGYVDLNPLVQECRDTLEPATRNREIRWHIPPLPHVQGDPALLKQVFANLLGNAVKYTRNCSIAEITLGCAGEENGRTIFFIRDNGAGFDMKYVDKLFGVFQRLHRTDEFEGTGIGLANVQRIILRHGGRVWAEAQVNLGATFYFTLKLASPGTSPTQIP